MSTRFSLAPSWTRPSDWPFADEGRVPRRFIRQQSGGDDPPDPVKALAIERDTFKAKLEATTKQLADLQKLVPSDQEREEMATLRKTAEQAEEERKRKAGEFDTWRAQLEKEKANEIAAREKRIADEAAARERAEKDLLSLHVANAFGSAPQLFGGSDAKTILTPAIAQSFLGQFVEATTENGKVRVVVKDREGSVILNTKTGQPADFAEAMDQLIPTLPDKDHILRGSGKVGSGSSGGASGHQEPPDLTTTIQRAARGEKDAIAALRTRQQGQSRIVSGAAWSRAADK